LTVVGGALGQILKQEHEDSAAELADALRSLRLELAEAQVTVAELRAAFAENRTKSALVDVTPIPRSVN
jgi:hypothetical protein